MPTPNWNDTFDETTDWSELAFLKMFQDAITERYNAVPNSQFVFVVPLVVGADVQKVNSSNAANNTINGWQQNVQGLSHLYALPDFNFTSSRHSFTNAGLGYSIYLYAGLNDMGFTRKRPREINSIFATSDLQGNPAVTGQFAYTNAIGGGVMTYNGSLWVNAPAGSRPDILDSNAASPNTIARGFTVAGDYIGPWIFNELRDTINQLKFVLFDSYTTPDDLVYPLNASGQGAVGVQSGFSVNIPPGSWTSFSSALSAAQTDYTNRGPSHSNYNLTQSDWGVYTQSSCEVVSGTNYYTVDISGERWGIGSAPWGSNPWGWAIPPSTQGRLYSFAAFGQPAVSPYISVFDANGVTDVNGTTVTPSGVYYNMEQRNITISSFPTWTNGSVTGRTITPSVTFGGNSSSVFMPDAGTAPAVNTTQVTGYVLTDAFNIIDFTVSGGFVYHA